MSAPSHANADPAAPDDRPLRVLILCTHNSARSQMGEGWLRHHAALCGLNAEVRSAGTEATQLKPEAVIVMDEVGIDIRSHLSKTLWELPDPLRFDVVLTVCDDANEACPSYPAETTRLHLAFEDPSGGDLVAWRRVRDLLGTTMQRLAGVLQRGDTPTEAAIEM